MSFSTARCLRCPPPQTLQVSLDAS